jgi:hypothetical protein
MLRLDSPTLFNPRNNLVHMAEKKSGIGKAIKFGAGLLIAGFAILNAIKAIKRATKAVKSAGGK